MNTRKIFHFFWTIQRFWFNICMIFLLWTNFSMYLSSDINNSNVDIFINRHDKLSKSSPFTAIQEIVQQFWYITHIHIYNVYNSTRSDWLWAPCFFNYFDLQKMFFCWGTKKLLRIQNWWTVPLIIFILFFKINFFSSLKSATCTLMNCNGRGWRGRDGGFIENK